MNNKNVACMSYTELLERVNEIYDVCIALMLRNNYYKYWVALGYDFEYTEGAVRIGKAIATGNDAYVMQCFEDLNDEAIMQSAGMTEEEYFENPEVPIWKREDWKWNEAAQEWEENEE